MSQSPVPAANPRTRCPVCGDSNQCRMEAGEAFKGPCWCERVTLSVAALRRLADESPEPRCLCPRCLKAVAKNPEITREELRRGGKETE